MPTVPAPPHEVLGLQPAALARLGGHQCWSQHCMGCVQEQAALQGAREEQCCVSPQLTLLKALCLSPSHHQAGSFSPAFPGQPPSALPRSSMGKGSCTQGQLRVNLSLTQDWAAFTLCFVLPIPFYSPRGFFSVLKVDGLGCL